MPLWRHSPQDLRVVLPALALGLLAPGLPWLSGHGLWGMSLATCAIALAVWWLSNTVAHVHLHTPVFRARALNRLFALALTLLTGVPQTLWRARHLAHHRGERPGRVRLGLQGSLELGLLAHLWLLLAVRAPAFLVGAYLPGLLLGLGLCQLQGRGEHLGPRPAGISHDGRLYNLLWLNDGYHAEHHRWPGAHWSDLPRHRLAAAARSSWPPVLRELPALARRLAAAPALGELARRLAVAPALGRLARRAAALPRLAQRLLAAALGGLERLALACPPLQRYLVRTHARAIARLLPRLAACRPGHVPSDLSQMPWRVAVVGGGLFPRTALALARAWPAARVTLLDADADHLERARRWLARGPLRPEFMHTTWDPRGAQPFDLVIVPLALVGDRAAVYAADGPPRLVHDWLWRRRGPGVVVSWPLLKRLNLVVPPA